LNKFLKNLDKIILGTVQFGLDYGINNKAGRPSDIELEKILLQAYDNNIFFLDTAEAYGDAQKRIGAFHLSHPNRKFNIISKFHEPAFFGNFRIHIFNDLRELNTDILYAYLFHNLNDLKKYSKNVDQLIKLKEEGFICKLGVSLYTIDEIEQVLNKFDFIDLIQIPFNIFDNINQKGNIILKMKEKGIEVHTRSAFLQGLFFNKKLPNKLISLQPYIDILYKLSSKYSLPVSELALNYCLCQPNISKVLIGVDTESQLIENISGVNQLSSEILEEINNIYIENTKLLNPVNW